MSFYKIRHKATGRFYKPAAGYAISNLSKDGKVYNRLGLAKSAAGGILAFGYCLENKDEVTKVKNFFDAFEIVEYRVEEVGVIDEEIQAD